jgi:hypothetical protein
MIRSRDCSFVVRPVCFHPNSVSLFLSASDSNDSDWSIGWLEPHAPDFLGDVDADDSFAVLVPCYRHDCKELEKQE